MKRIYCFLLLTANLAFVLPAQAQSYTAKLLPQKVTVQYPDHTVVAEVKPSGTFSASSKLHYYWFSGNQINTTQGGYSGKALNGIYQDFYLHKNLRQAGQFDQGLKTGTWKSWYENGHLEDLYTFKHGQKSGVYVKYDSAGVITEKGSYLRDQLHGKQQLITADSTRVFHYKKGKQVQPKSILPRFIYKLLPGKTKS